MQILDACIFVPLLVSLTKATILLRYLRHHHTSFLNHMLTNHKVLPNILLRILESARSTCITSKQVRTQAALRRQRHIRQAGIHLPRSSRLTSDRVGGVINRAEEGAIVVGQERQITAASGVERPAAEDAALRLGDGVVGGVEDFATGWLDVAVRASDENHDAGSSEYREPSAASCMCRGEGGLNLHLLTTRHNHIKVQIASRVRLHTILRDTEDGGSRVWARVAKTVDVWAVVC